MNNNLPPKVVRHRGMSLLELTVVLTVVLALFSIVFIGARAWKRGTDRSSCIITLRNVQVAARSYQNLYGYDYGGRPYAVGGTQDIARHLYRKGYIEEPLYHQALGDENCPSGGSYDRSSPDMFPEVGQLYMTCSLAKTDEHAPQSHANW